MPQHHPRSGVPGRLHQGQRVGVGFPADLELADHLPTDDQLGLLPALGRHAWRRGRGAPAQAGAGRRRLVRVRLGRGLVVQQRVADLIDPVLIPPRRPPGRGQHHAVVPAQRRAVNEHHPDPVQPAQHVRVQHQQPAPGQTPAQHAGKRLPA
jgi:hypothetical protein